MNKEFPFVITNMPDRKKPCLCWEESENCLVKIASFNNEEAKDIFIREMNDWIKKLYDN